MLEPADSVVLAAGVRLEGAVLVDDLRGSRLPVNPTARFVLERSGRPLGEIAIELAAAYGLDPGRARDDVFAFAFRLNRLLLANVDRGRGPVARIASWVGAVLHLAPSGGYPRPAWRRVALDTTSRLRSGVGAVSAVRARAVALGLLAAALGMQTAGLSRVAPPTAWLAVGAAVAVGLAVHEAGHALALSGVPAAIALAGSRTFVIHSRLVGARRRLVAAAGPSVPIALATLAAGVAQPVESTALALAGCAFGGHAIGLTVATRDGREACGQ